MGGCAAPAEDQARSLIPADADGAPAAAVLPHWDTLIARSGSTPAVRWSAWGTPMSLFGDLSSPRGSVSGDGARDFLADNARLFQLSDDLAELDEQSVVESPLGTHVTFTQRHEGVPVYGAEVKVHFEEKAKLYDLAALLNEMLAASGGVPMTVAGAAKPIEQFTIEMVPADKQLTLKLSWERTVASVAIAQP